MHQDAARRDAYLRRHAARERWSDPDTAGFWARWLLWNRATLGASVRDTERRFGLCIAPDS